MTIQRKTIEDIIASREKSGGNIGGLNGGIRNNTMDCNSDINKNDNKMIGGLNGGLNNDHRHVLGINSRQKRIMSLIKLKPAVIVEQMATILSISKRTLERDLSMLQKEGIIKHEGSKKSGIWIVLEPYNTDME